MLNIGEFARLGQVSPRMLRHYDQLGLLTPEQVNDGTGYRSYAVHQLERLHQLLALRDLGFKLEQIGDLLAPSGEGIEILDLPVIEVASVIHRGDMETVTPVYEALVRWIEDSGFRLAGYSRELYHEMTADGSSVTELQIPVAR